jgi:hypothetical protein
VTFDLEVTEQSSFRSSIEGPRLVEVDSSSQRQQLIDGPPRSLPHNPESSHEHLSTEQQRSPEGIRQRCLTLGFGGLSSSLSSAPQSSSAAASLASQPPSSSVNNWQNAVMLRMGFWAPNRNLGPRLLQALFYFCCTLWAALEFESRFYSRVSCHRKDGIVTGTHMRLLFLKPVSMSTMFVYFQAGWNLSKLSGPVSRTTALYGMN